MLDVIPAFKAAGAFTVPSVSSINRRVTYRTDDRMIILKKRSFLRRLKPIREELFIHDIIILNDLQQTVFLFTSRHNRCNVRTAD